MNYKSLSQEQFDDLVASVVKGIAYTENGGKPNLANPVAGKTGEAKSIFQFLPSTWKGYAKEILGDENAPLNQENETKVVYEKVKKWLQDDYTVSQIGSMWNAGAGEPNAYKGKFEKTTKTHKAGDPSTGINKQYNVKFDVPGYASKVNDYSQKFFEERKNKYNVAETQTQPQPLTETPLLGSKQEQPVVENNSPANMPGLLQGLIKQKLSTPII